MTHVQGWMVPLYFIAPLLQVAIAWIMYRRAWHRIYPLFFVYNVQQVARAGYFFVLLYRLRTTHDQRYYAVYFFSYWVLEAVDVALVVAILFRTFRHFFEPYRALKKWSGLFFAIALCACLALAAITASVSPDASDRDHLIRVLMLLTRSTVILRVGLLAFLFLLSFVFRISLREYVFGIAAGFGVAASITLAAVAARSQFGPEMNRLFSYLNSGAFTIAAVIWFVYLVAPRRNQELTAAIPSGDELSCWNESLSEFVKR